MNYHTDSKGLQYFVVQTPGGQQWPVHAPGPQEAAGFFTGVPGIGGITIEDLKVFQPSHRVAYESPLNWEHILEEVAKEKKWWKDFEAKHKPAKNHNMRRVL